MLKDYLKLKLFFYPAYNRHVDYTFISICIDIVHVLHVFIFNFLFVIFCNRIITLPSLKLHVAGEHNKTNKNILMRLVDSTMVTVHRVPWPMLTLKDNTLDQMDLVHRLEMLKAKRSTHRDP